MGVRMELPAIQTPSVPGQGRTYHDKYVVVYNFKDVGKRERVCYPIPDTG